MKNKIKAKAKPLTEITKKLEQDAANGNVKDAIGILNNNEAIIKQLSEDHSIIIEYFYSPYSIAYDLGNFDFCRQYQKAIDGLTGVDSIFFVDES